MPVTQIRFGLMRVHVCEPLFDTNPTTLMGSPIVHVHV